MGTVANIKVEPVNAQWGEDVMQVEKITCVADVSSSLNSKYFNFYTTGGVHHYAWFDVGSAGTDPTISGATGHEVDISANATANEVASALQAILDAVTGFDASVSASEVTLTATTAGYAKPAHEGAAATGFSFSTDVYGDAAVDLGYCDGNIEATHEEQYVDVTAHQTGTQVLSQIHTGNSVTVTLNLKESTINQIRKILTAEGNTLIPDGTGLTSSEVMGYGTDRQFKQTLGRARKLILHPTVLPASNKSRDLTCWKAFPKLSGLSFSGDSILLLPVEFMVYPDYTKAPQVNMCVIGDSTQTLT